jgi:formate dehydrogenase subunit beta
MTQRFLVPIGQDGAEVAVRQILAHVWQQAGLSGILIPHSSSKSDLPMPAYLESPEDLGHASMLAPYMPYNAASKAVELLETNPGEPIGLALKPCELRSLVQFSQGSAIDMTSAVTISSDCLAVYPPEDIQWRMADETVEALTEEVLRFAPQGGILLSRFQQSCQICERPYPIDADLQIELIGLDAKTQMVIAVREPAWLESIGMNLQPMAPDLLEKRARILENIVSWRAKARQSTSEKLDPNLASPAGLMTHLKGCQSCRAQLEAMCLQYHEDAFGTKAAVFEWVGTCSGCGTCDYQCPTDFPLFNVIAHLNDLYAQREDNRVH